MMKRLLIALSLVAAAALPARANVACALPFNLQNGTTADATQVMANYNALVACLGNAAIAGANNDITSLTALSTPISPAQGGSVTYVGALSTGSANAQSVTAVVPTNFSLTAGRQVTFISNFNNTGATTLNVAFTGAVNFYRRTQFGIAPMVGGELVQNHQVTAIYDGTQWQIISITPAMVGEIRDYTGLAANAPPAGWLYADGSCLSRTTYAALFAVISTNFDPTGSTCDGASFALPDARGRVLAGQDNQGGNGAASRITTGGGGCNGSIIGGAGCGAQNVTMSQGNLPSVSFTVSGITLSDPGHTHTASVTDPGHSHGITYNNVVGLTGTGAGGFAGGAFTSAQVNASINSNTTGVTVSNASSTTGVTIGSQGSAASGGNSTPMLILPPLQIVKKMIKL